MTVLEEAKRRITALENKRAEIESAMEYQEGTHTFDDIVSMVLQGRLRVFEYEQSIALTEILEYPQQKHYHVFIAGGNLKELMSHHEDLIVAAKEAGCVKLTISGRKGWLRVLEPLGWKEQYTACICEVAL